MPESKKKAKQIQKKLAKQDKEEQTDKKEIPKFRIEEVSFLNEYSQQAQMNIEELMRAPRKKQEEEILEDVAEQFITQTDDAEEKTFETEYSSTNDDYFTKKYNITSQDDLNEYRSGKEQSAFATDKQPEFKAMFATDKLNEIEEPKYTTKKKKVY
jgi:hypothetical protein